jgi:hypothetical protein
VQAFDPTALDFAQVFQVICKGWKWWDERVVDNVGRREAVSTTRLRSGLYIYSSSGPQVATGACGHQQQYSSLNTFIDFGSL